MFSSIVILMLKEWESKILMVIKLNLLFLQQKKLNLLSILTTINIYFHFYLFN